MRIGYLEILWKAPKHLVDAKIRELLLCGEKIKAVKEARTFYNLGLCDAVEHVKKIAKRLRMPW